MRLIDADALIKNYFDRCRTEFEVINHCISDENVVHIIQNAPTVEERPTGKWNRHQVACILAELFGDTCACNYCGIDEWLPKVCDFANKECPDVVGVACWEQFLKHRAKMKGGEEE